VPYTPTVKGCPARAGAGRLKARKPSVIVVFKLVPHCENGDALSVFDFKQPNIPRSSEWNDELAQERAPSGLATSERRASERCKPTADRSQSLFGQCQIASAASEFSLENDIEQALEVVLGLAREPNAECHFRLIESLARAA